jgi:hypothetical protein
MLHVRHSIDNMHVKKNVCEATCGTLLQRKSKGKNHKNARADLKELGIRSELYAEETGTGTVIWTSLGPLPWWVPGPTTRWAPGTTRHVPHGSLLA